MMKNISLIAVTMSFVFFFLASCEKDSITNNSELASEDVSSSAVSEHMSSSLPPFIDDVCLCTQKACNDGLEIDIRNPLSPDDSAKAQLFAVHPESSELIEASNPTFFGDFSFTPASIDTSWEDIELFLVIESDTSAPITISPEWNTFICNHCSGSAPECTDDYNSHYLDTLDFVFE